MNPPQNTHRILVVDDNPAIHDDFRKILCGTASDSATALQNLEDDIFGTQSDPLVSSTFEMDSAYQGQEALALVQAAHAAGRPYSLAFVDVRMPPGWDGIETIAHIWREHPALQIVICTAFSDHSWADILRKLGESDSLIILKKPFDNVEVLQLAHTLTKKWTVTRQANARLADLDEIVRQRTRELLAANQQLQAEINHRNTIEGALRDSEERFHKAFETAAIALAIQHADSQRFTDVNASFARLVGLPEDDICGKTAAELQLFTTPEIWDQLTHQLAAGETIANAELLIQRPDQSQRQTLVSLEPLTLNHQPHLLAALTDVTDQRQLEALFRQSQKMEAIGQLAAGVAHDFNNVLTVIHGHASLQLSRRSLDPDLARSLGEIQLAAKRAAALTRQLLTFSHKQVIQSRPLDLNVVLTQTQGMLRRMVGETVTIDWQPCPTPAIVRADLSNLEQVIMNLVINARDAMLPAGGTVTLTLALVDLDAPALRHSDAQPGRHVVLTIRDTGCGMDPATMHRIFEPFFTTKPVGQGTGLGLATVYGIVKQHTGWLTVESTPGQGSTFRIYLPTSGEPARATIRISTHAQPAQLPGHGETILVAEDESSVREFVTTVLTQNGYQVLAADSGASALEVWESATQPIALLFTDMVMPNAMSGSLLASLLRQRDPRLKVIYTSGYSSEMVAHGQIISEGVNFLPKPFSQQQLLELVRRALHSPVETLKPATALCGT